MGINTSKKFKEIEIFTKKILTTESGKNLTKILTGLTIGTSAVVFGPQILPAAAMVAASREAIPILSEFGSHTGETYLEHVALAPFVEKTWKCIKSKFKGRSDEEIADAVGKLAPEEQAELTLEISKVIEKSMKESVNDDEFILNLTNAIISNKEFKEEIRKSPELERKVDDIEKDISTKVDKIKEEIKTLTEIKLPKIESVLEKEKSKEARFFRPSGSEWIDFEEGFVVERKEVDGIIKEFENKDIIVIKGNPASGKSAILRNVGYKLANQGKDVYVIELKKTPLAIEGVLKMCHGYLLIDDVHLNPEYVDDIAKNLHNVKILLSTRDIEERFGPTSPLKIPEYFKDAIEIKGHDAVEGIIQKFNEKRRKIPERVQKKITKNNLWILAWELEAYEEFDKIDEDTVYERVKDYIRKDLKNLGVRNAENVFLPLSVFYRYEIPLRKEFVEKLSDCGDIEKLIEFKEINELEENGFEYLTLYHSEVAEIFLKTFQKFDGFGNKVKERVEGDWSEKLFHLYVQKFPKECIDVIKGLRYPHYESILIKSLVDENFDIVIEGIEAEEDVEKICWCVRNISEASKEVADNLVRRLDLKKFRDKIYAEKDVFKIGDCILEILEVNKEVTNNLVKSLHVKRLRDKLELEKSFMGCLGIGWGIMAIYFTNKEFGEKLVRRLDVGKLKDKIDAEENVNFIGFCITIISDVSKKFGKNLVNSLNFEILKNKIEASKNLWDIGCCIKGISKCNKKVTEKLIPVVIDKIEASKDVEKISRCIFEIADVNEEVAEMLIPVSKNKFETEKNVETLSECMYWIWIRSEEVAFKIVDQLDPDKVNTDEVRKNLYELIISKNE